MTAVAPFHTSCSISGLAVCTCPHGQLDRSSLKDRPANLRQQAASTWDLWQGQSQLFAGPNPVEIQLPRLRREVSVPTDSHTTAGLPDRRTAETRVVECSERARQAVLYAARCAAAAGLQYNPSIDIGIDLQSLPGLPPARAFELDSKAAAVRQALAERHAQAQAAAAALSAVPPPQIVSTRADSASTVQHPGSFGSPQAARLQSPSASVAGPMPPLPNGMHSKASSAIGAVKLDLPHHQQTAKLARPLLHQEAEDDANAKRPRAAPPRAAPAATLAQAPSTSVPRAQAAPARPPKAAAGDGKRRLRMADARSLLEGQWLQLFWPDDGTWWPAQVLEMDVRACTCTLLYETGEEERDCQLAQLIEKGEVAWLDGVSGPAAASNSTGGRTAQRPQAPLAGAPDSVVGPHVPAHRVGKRARSNSSRARLPASQPRLPHHLSGPHQQPALQHKAAPARQQHPAAYRSDSENDISSLSEDEDFLPSSRRAHHAPARGVHQQPAGAAQAHSSRAPGGMAAVLALGGAAVGRQVRVLSLGPDRQQYNARITGAPPGQGHVLVQYDVGTETELHQSEENKLFLVQLVGGGSQ